MDRKFIRNVLKDYVQSNIPASFDGNLWPRIQAHIAQEAESSARQMPQALHSHKYLPVLSKTIKRTALVTTVAILILAVCLLVVSSLPGFTKPTPVSAAEILAKIAGASPSTGNLSGIQSSHEVLTIRYRNSSTDQFTEGTSEWWDQAPDKSRTQVTLHLPGGETAHSLSGDSNGAHYLYLEKDNEFRIYSSNNMPTSLGTDLDTASRRAAQIVDINTYDATISGEEILDGRPAYVLDFTMKSSINDAPNSFNPSQYRKKVWIDKQAYVILKEQDWNKDDVLLYDLQYQTLEINPSLDATTFEFTPPPGSIVADMRQPIVSDLDTAWRDAAREISTPLYRVTSYPEWMVPGRPYYDVSQGIVSQAFTTQTGRAGDVLSMVVSEGAPSAPSLSARGWGGSTEIHVGELIGYLYNKNDAYMLNVDPAGTRISIYAPGNATYIKSELANIANSVEIVPKK